MVKRVGVVLLRQPKFRSFGDTQGGLSDARHDRMKAVELR
jgi:hypothetical protein